MTRLNSVERRLDGEIIIFSIKKKTHIEILCRRDCVRPHQTKWCPNALPIGSPFDHSNHFIKNSSMQISECPHMYPKV